MALHLALLCLFSFADLLLAKDEAVVFIVDPYWDAVSEFMDHSSLLKDYKIFKVVTHRGEAGSVPDQISGSAPDQVSGSAPDQISGSAPDQISGVFTYNSKTPNDSKAAHEICPKLKSLGIPIAAIIPTSDPTVGLTDLLAACVGVRGNPSEGPLKMARRDKWAMGEAVRMAGLRSAKQKFVSTWPEAKEYLESLNPPLSQDNPVIFKILEGTGGNGVQKICSMKEAEEVFSSEVGNKDEFGDSIGALVIQEFLKGKEYVIDSVTRDGAHKVVVVWHEDLRTSNGIFRQYFGFKAQNPEDPKTKAIIDYAKKVLTATGFRNGAADMEVIWLEEEGQPCLVEVNARWTGLTWRNGVEFEREIFGQDQITATINAYLDVDAFNKMPPVLPMSQYAAIVFSVNHHAGILKDIPGMRVTSHLPSYVRSTNNFAVEGKWLGMTGAYTPIHIFLANSDKNVLDADYDDIIDLENANAFFDTTPSTGYTSLTALRAGNGSLSGPWLPAIGALALLAVATVLGLIAMSQWSVRDGTEYLIVN